MGTSVFFNNFQNSMEQTLIEDLVIESIGIYGHDMFYCPRTLVATDKILGESPMAEYNQAYELDLYIKSFDSYGGDGQFLSKFNLEIRDQMTLTVAIRNFNNEVGQYTGQSRPGEGDLIYIPMVDRILVIKFVEKVAVFYQMGALQTFDLVCEPWEYSSERLNTGIDAIDSIEKNLTLNIASYGILTHDGYSIADNDNWPIIQTAFDFSTQARDWYEDNTEIQTESDGILDFSEINPFSENNY